MSKKKTNEQEGFEQGAQPEKEILDGLTDAEKAIQKNADAILAQLIESTRVMELIKSQFGYSGYSNPNYVSLDKTIIENKKMIDGITG